MMTINFSTANDLTKAHYAGLLNVDPVHPHVHRIDMPFRITSRWQDQGCQFGMWERDGQVQAWAVFQPPWRTLDFAVHPSWRGSALEGDVFAWGKQQMVAYAQRTGERFTGVVEFFEDMPGSQKTAANLEQLGFAQQDWSTFRFAIDLNQAFPAPVTPDGFTIRPVHEDGEAVAYADLVQAVFGRGWLSEAWRRRMLAHPAYRHALDLVVEQPGGGLVGFCTCWLHEATGQIEPLGIHPDFQGMGLGRALERAAVGALKACQARTLLVDHGSINEKAVALSLKTGFQKVNNAVRYGVVI